MRRVTALIILLLLLTSLSLVSQDLTGQERIRVTNPGVETGWPYTAANGKGEIGLFAMWFGGSGTPDGIIFRKLDKEGKPLGPQKFAYKTNPSETLGFWLHGVTFANGHYFLAVHNSVQNSFVLLKFSENGTLVKKIRHKFGDREKSQRDFVRGTIFGDSIYFMQNTSEGIYFILKEGEKKPGGDRKTENYLLKANLDNPVKFEKIQLTLPTDERLVSFGISADADKIVATLAVLAPGFDPEFVGPRIVTYDPVTEEVFGPVALGSHQEFGFLLNNLQMRPVYNGKGHLFQYQNWNLMNFTNYSIVYDNIGQTIYGPTDIRENGSFWFPYFTDLIGSSTVINSYDILKSAIGAFIIGPKGKHSTTIYYDETINNRFQFGSLGHVFTGNNLVFCYLGWEPAGVFVFTKATPTPKPVRDGIAFFQAGSKSFADGSRNLIWSAVGSESVTLKHDGKEYTKLPPQYTFLLKGVNLKKPVELTFTSAAGKTYSRKLRLK